MQVRILTLIVSVFMIYSILAIDIPFSRTPVITDENKLTGYRRIDPEDWIEDHLNSSSWLWYDEDNMYVQMRCDKDSNFSYGNFTPRDYGSDGDFLRIQVITNYRAFFGYFFVAYPNGSLWDGVRNPDINIDSSWNSSYSYEVDDEEDYWQVRMKIPLADLRFEQSLPYRWKVIVTRYNYKTKHYYSYPAFSTSEGKQYFVKAADITLHHKIKRNLNLKLMPYYVKSYDLVNKTETYDPENVGLDISFNPSTRIKSKISINPDFSDIPMDNTTDNYNNKYPVYYYEQRYFFTEDIDAFGIEDSEFYSRNIVQPQLAFKLTGNSNSIYYGILGAKDKKIMDGDDLINNDDYFQVIAVRPELSRLRFNNAIISRTNTGYYHHLLSSTLKYEFIQDTFFRCYYMGSLRKDETESNDTVKGNGISLSLIYSPKEWNLHTYYSRLDKDLTSDSGYYNDSDFHKAGYGISYNRDNREEFLKSWNFGHYGEIYEFNLSDDPYKEYSLSGNLSFVFLPKASIWGNIRISKEYDLINHAHKPWYVSFGGSKSYDKLSFYGSTGLNRSITYSLNKMNYRYSQHFNADYQFSKTIQGGMSLSNVYVDCDKLNLVQDGDEYEEVRLDNAYQIFNGYFNYNPGIKTSLRMGLGLSTYETETISASMSYYCNLGYEFRKDSFFYMGYKTNQVQDEKGTFDRLLGHFIKNRASAYLKVALVL